MRLTAAQLAEATGGTLLAEGPPGPVVTDTRKLQPGDWFLALRGDRFDGHDFLGRAADADCAGVIVDTAPEEWARGLLRVDDTLVALQDCGRWVRRGFTGPVVGVTGSAGKTTSRVMIAEVLAHLGLVHQNEGNLNNHFGLPMTLLALEPGAAAMVLEMGMSGPGEIALLQDIGRPTVRLITNVSAAHTQGTGGVEGVARCKQEMFDGAAPGDVLVVNDDDPHVRAMPHPPGVRVLRYGSSPGCDVQLQSITVDAATLSTTLRASLPGGPVEAVIPSPGRHIGLSALGAAAVGAALDLPISAIAAGLARYRPVGMRMRVERRGGLVVLNDAYNANPASMRGALETLAALPGRRIALLGDMLELGDIEAEAHAEVVALAGRLGLDLLGLAGPRMVAQAENVGETPVIVARDAAELGPKVAPRLRSGDVVLLKGSRGARMERILQALPDVEP
ncbi:MAG: UDP-N-acetylmuramoyl-tripeptide--D-alanyl-D-alanine ligase [Alphaproteobacteria bacterium]|nr:UDP-N-acetylmuramoyl-tripeptide--D-alanyl-D-alanine ligase [Alphaproteobacteria bacterium]